MSRHKGVVDALSRLRKAGQSPKLPQSSHLLPPARQHLMGVALVPHVKDQAVHAGVKHPVDGHRQLHRAQIGRQMAPGPGDILDQFPAQVPA